MSGSDHILKMLLEPDIIDQAAATAQTLDRTWIDQVRRIILEYCPSGSLHDLIEMRIQR